MSATTLPHAPTNEAEPRKPANDGRKLIEAKISLVEGAERGPSQLEVHPLILRQGKRPVFYVS